MALLTAGDVRPSLGTPIDRIETPAVVVDLDTMEANLRRFAGVAREEGVRLRSHVKTHKIPDIARQESEIAGGGGIVCQTLGEVEVMAASGLRDIYLSYMVVEPPKLDRLVRLAADLDRFATTVDAPGNVDPLSEAAVQHDTTVETVIEIDVGFGRTGVRSPEAAVALADHIANQSHLQLAGVMAFEGHVEYDPDVDSEAEFERRCLAAMDDVATHVTAIEEAGRPVDEVKVGSTPTALYSATHPIVTEINPGMYPFNDVNTVRSTPAITMADCAATVLTTVISKPTSELAIVDAGSKAIALELEEPPVEAHHPGVAYANASEEHGWIDTSDHDGDPIEIGDRLEFVVPHVCPTINLYDTLVGIRDGTVEAVWAVQARGKVR